MIEKTINGKKIKFFQNKQLNDLLIGFSNAVHKYNTSAVFIIDGRSGMGKTTIGIQSGITLDDNFNLDKIFFEPESFLKGLAEAKKGDCLMFDEAMLISSRSALSAINRMVIQAMSMIRSKNIFVIFCVNSIFDLDRNLSISRADLLIHVYGETLISRGRFACFFKAKDGFDRIKNLYINGRKYYSYSKPKSNLTGTFPKEFIINEKEYDLKKDKYVNKFLKNTLQRQTNALITRNNLVRWNINEEGYPVKKIAKVCDLTEVTIYQILKEKPQEPNKTKVSGFKN